MSDKKEEKKRVIRNDTHVTMAGPGPGPGPGPGGVGQPAEQGADMTLFYRQDFMTNLAHFLDFSSFLTLRGTSKGFRAVMVEEAVARKGLQEIVGPDLTKLIKPDETAKEAYIRHKAVLNTESLRASVLLRAEQLRAEDPEQMTDVRVRHWLSAVQHHISHFPYYYPETIITALLRRHKTIGNVIEYFPQYKEKIIKRVMADKRAFINQFKNPNLLAKFLRSNPQYLAPVIENLLEPSVFIEIFTNVKKLIFLYNLPVPLAAKILRQIMDDKRMFNPLFKSSNDLLFFAKAFPAEAKKFIEQILADEVLAGVIKSEDELWSLLFPFDTQTAEKILLQWQERRTVSLDKTPSATLPGRPMAIDKKKEVKTWFAPLNRNPLVEDNEAAYVGLAKFGPDMRALIKSGQTAHEAYQYHQGLIRRHLDLSTNNFFLGDDGSERILEAEIEGYKSLYYPAVIFQALFSRIYMMFDVVKIIDKFPRYENLLLDVLYANEKNFNGIVFEVVDLIKLTLACSRHFSLADLAFAPNSIRVDRRLARLIHYLLSQEDSFMHVINNVEQFLHLLNQCKNYKDVISHHILTQKKILRHIFKESKDLFYFINHSCEKDESLWYQRHFKQALIVAILEDEVLFPRFFRDSAALGFFVSKYGRRAFTVTSFNQKTHEMVDQVLSYVIAHPRVFDDFFQKKW